MKGFIFIIGLILGAIAVWGWYHTGGKIYITETKTVTNEVAVNITETQIIEHVQYITLTNYVSVPAIIKTEKVIKEKISEHPYPNATISRVEPDGITYITDTGVVKVPFSQLPKDVQKKYGYDSAKAMIYEANQRSIAAERDMQVAERLKQKKEKELAVWKQNQDYIKGMEEKKAAEKAAAQSNAVQKTTEVNKPAVVIKRNGRKHWDGKIKTE